MNTQRLRDRLRVETAARLEGEIEAAIAWAHELASGTTHGCRWHGCSNPASHECGDISAPYADVPMCAEHAAEWLSTGGTDPDTHDNEADGLKRCTDCGGSGWVTLFTGRQHCPTCDGSGWT